MVVVGIPHWEEEEDEDEDGWWGKGTQRGRVGEGTKDREAVRDRLKTVLRII